MGFVGRLLLRLIVVPIGAALAVYAATAVSFAANWDRFVGLVHGSADTFPMADIAVGALMALVFSYATLTMLLPAFVGILIAEAFAIRSWIFHALNGALSIWVGWAMLGNGWDRHEFYDNPLAVLAAGIAAGFVYWAVAGWSAGVMKPDRPGAAPPAAPAAGAATPR